MSAVQKISDVAGLIGCFSSLAEVARVTGSKPGAVLKWRSRGAIPARYHGPLIDAARAKGFCQITPQLMVDIHRVPSTGPFPEDQFAGGGE